MDRHEGTVRAAWHELAEPAPALGTFDPGDVDDLPGPARRLLRFALEPGVALSPTVVLDMQGHIRIGTWVPMVAEQVLRVGAGMVWRARVGMGPAVVRGADLLWRGRAGLDFRLWGLVSVAHAQGPDVDRSTVGRFAAETVAWAPQALLPALGATWEEVDGDRAVVTLSLEGHEVAVTVTVDDDGRLRHLELDRWGDPERGHFGWHPFGGPVTGHRRFDGIAIASAGTVGWHPDAPDPTPGAFFRYRVTRARFPHLAVGAPDPVVLGDGAP